MNLYTRARNLPWPDPVVLRPCDGSRTVNGLSTTCASMCVAHFDAWENEDALRNAVLPFVDLLPSTEMQAFWSGGDHDCLPESGDDVPVVALHRNTNDFLSAGTRRPVPAWTVTASAPTSGTYSVLLFVDGPSAEGYFDALVEEHEDACTCD